MRQWKLLIACEVEGGRSVDELRALLGASRRTIYRDLLILKDSGANFKSIKRLDQIRYQSLQPFFLSTPSYQGAGQARDNWPINTPRPMS